MLLVDQTQSVTSASSNVITIADIKEKTGNYFLVQNNSYGGLNLIELIVWIYFI